MRHNTREREKIAKYAAANSSARACRKYKIGTQTIRAYREEFGMSFERSNATKPAEDVAEYSGLHPAMLMLCEARAGA